MGVDARWICHTCKTMCCADGARSVISCNAIIEDVEQFLLLAPRITDGHYINGWERLIGICNNYLKWAGRHKEHKTVISNDHAVDRSDLPDYRSEAVDGELGEMTFGEEELAEADYYFKHHCPSCGQRLPND